jgi:hypothetical protein
MPDADRADYVRALVAHRCEEIGPDDLALIGTIHPGAPSRETLPLEIGEQIMDAIAALENKLDWLAEAVGLNKDDDDDDTARRRAG